VKRKFGPGLVTTFTAAPGLPSVGWRSKSRFESSNSAIASGGQCNKIPCCRLLRRHAQGANSVTVPTLRHLVVVLSVEAPFTEWRTILSTIEESERRNWRPPTPQGLNKVRKIAGVRGKIGHGTGWQRWCLMSSLGVWTASTARSTVTACDCVPTVKLYPPPRSPLH